MKEGNKQRNESIFTQTDLLERNLTLPPMKSTTKFTRNGEQMALKLASAKVWKHYHCSLTNLFSPKIDLLADFCSGAYGTKIRFRQLSSRGFSIRPHCHLPAWGKSFILLRAMQRQQPSNNYQFVHVQFNDPNSHKFLNWTCDSSNKKKRILQTQTLKLLIITKPHRVECAKMLLSPCSDAKRNEKRE